MGLCSCSSKVMIITINILFWIGAALSIYAGVWYLRGEDKVIDNPNDYRPAYITFAIATLLFVCGLIGIAGAFSEKKSLLGIFVVIVLFTLVISVGGSAVLFVKRDSVLNATANATDVLFIKEYNIYGSPNLTERLELGSGAPKANHKDAAVSEGHVNSTLLVDFVQTSLECCGWDNYTEWDNYEYWTKTLKNTGYVPSSCCNKTYANANSIACPNLISTENEKDLISVNACKAEVNKFAKYVYKFLNWTAVAFAIFVFVGLAASVFLFCRKRSSDGFNYSSIVS